MSVLEAKDGPSGVAKAKEEQPDVILLGVMMPGLDGRQVAEELLEDHETREIPIAFLTARAEFTDRARGFNLGAVDYITKPFNPVELALDVRELLRRLARGEREELRRERMNHLLENAEAVLRDHSPTEFETTAKSPAKRAASRGARQLVAPGRGADAIVIVLRFVAGVAASARPPALEPQALAIRPGGKAFSFRPPSGVHTMTSSIRTPKRPSTRIEGSSVKVMPISSGVSSSSETNGCS